MDLQAQVAARRAELERQARHEQWVAAEQLRLQQELEKAQHEATLDAIAVEVSGDGVDVVREGNRLALVKQVAPIDMAGLRRAEVEKLLKREARKMWAPGENWVVIAPTVAGFCLLPFVWYVSVILWAWAGFARWNFKTQYEAKLRALYPSLFSAG
ncbi:hypothetical protein [Brevundimonas naejangsanensis]|uniref:hypothetical protein n=1 Tax=Brevundimonas naejangsanensis TaxID=588932 RepID=UPI0026E96D5C|nr:hypothetical protein [Brevundimonas naejangsanensis]